MGAHGVRGDVRVMTYNPESPLLVQGGSLYLETDEGYQEVILTFVRTASRGWVAHLSGIEDREQAKALYQESLYASREQLGPLGQGETYIFDLIGLTVKDAESGTAYGQIRDVLQTGAHDCYEVYDGKRELLVPVTEEVVRKVDLQKGEVLVILPEGLLDIYEN